MKVPSCDHLWQSGRVSFYHFILLYLLSKSQIWFYHSFDDCTSPGHTYCSDPWQRKILEHFDPVCCAELTGLWFGDGDQYPKAVWDIFDVSSSIHPNASWRLQRDLQYCDFVLLTTTTCDTCIVKVCCLSAVSLQDATSLPNCSAHINEFNYEHYSPNDPHYTMIYGSNGTIGRVTAAHMTTTAFSVANFTNNKMVMTNNKTGITTCQYFKVESHSLLTLPGWILEHPDSMMKEK